MEAHALLRRIGAPMRPILETMTGKGSRGAVRKSSVRWNAS